MHREVLIAAWKKIPKKWIWTKRRWWLLATRSFLEGCSKMFYFEMLGKVSANKSRWSLIFNKVILVSEILFKESTSADIFQEISRSFRISFSIKKLSDQFFYKTPKKRSFCCSPSNKCLRLPKPFLPRWSFSYLHLTPFIYNNFSSSLIL